MDFILFNNGLHGWHLSEDEYAKCYDDKIKFLLQKYSDTPNFIVLSTYLDDKELNDRVVVRNEKAVEIADKYGLAVIDYYSIAENNKNLLLPDGVHFTQEGYTLFANELIDTINKASV